MTIDFWGLGLQAVNVLILVWLLSRVFWRPVAAAIAARQDAARTLMSDAKTAKAAAEAALAEITKTRAGMTAERDAILAEATIKAEAAAKAALADADAKAEKRADAARLAADREAKAAQAKGAAASAQLAVDIAQKLLARLDTAEVQAAFLGLFVKAIEEISATDRAALAATTDIDLISTHDLSTADRATITKAVADALGDKPKLTFVTDTDLVAGFELRTAHFVLTNSWRSDLAAILKGLTDAA